ncbi:MAG TPA: hypothetical protein VIM58_10375 [Candidatus Methylacidiphilales bacterium]
MKNKILSLLGALALALPVPGRADERQILVCTSAQASPAIRQAVADFLPRAANAPLIKALRSAQDAGEVVAKTGDDLLAPQAYDAAAHNHLIVVGLRSHDPLLDKIGGFVFSIDEAKRQAYSTGWGCLQGDVGWIESDRNPFLHSRKIRTAPEDTVLVKITGTSDAGVLAALRAFEAGMLNGPVPAGAVSRPRTTLLDQEPTVAPAPFALPQSLKSTPAFLAGWTAVPGNEYRAILEAGGIEPEKMWRYKYLPPRLMEEAPIVRWFGGINARAMGNAVDVVLFKSHDDALAVARGVTKGGKFESLSVPGLEEPKRIAWPNENSESIQKSYGNTLVAVSGPYLLVSSLSGEATAEVAAAIR